jgi:LAO/AO transport system kinase
VHGFTGPPGVGKSTLVDAYITELRKRNLSVGVIAVDPSSPVSGGAILGDRVRMTSHGLDSQVFVRSIAARGHLGGLSATTAFVVDVMDAAGKDAIVIETVGAGQSEVEVARVADTKVVICAPGAGDDVQAIKSGILEIGDLLVVNKADLPEAEVTVNQLKGMLGLRRRDGWTPEVLATTATSGEGVAALADAILRHDDYLCASGRQSGSGPRLRALLAETAGRLAAERVDKLDEAALAPLVAAVRGGELDITSAAERLLKDVAAEAKGSN